MGEMEKLKHSIKIASYSRGFKLQMGTYFYKLMNYIDLVAFFDGGWTAIDFIEFIFDSLASELYLCNN